MFDKANKIKAMKMLYSFSGEFDDITIDHESLTKNEKLKNNLIHLAEINGLYYLCISKLLKSKVPLSYHQRTKWDLESSRMLSLSNTIDFLNKLNIKYGLNYILIKACSKIPHVPRDVDIFVDSNDKDKFYEILDREGFTIAYSNPVETAFNKEQLLKLDLYCSIDYIGMRFLSEQFLWNSKITDKFNNRTCYTLNDNANFLLLLVHSFFGHRRMTLLDFLQLNTLLITIDEDQCRNIATEMGWGLAFNKLLFFLKRLNESIYLNGDIVFFPYLFKRDFILECINSIEKRNITLKSNFFFEISIILDRFQYELEKTPFYSELLKFTFGRKCYNSFCYFVRNHRGDHHGIHK